MSYTPDGHCRDTDVDADWPFGESDFDVSGRFNVGDSTRDDDDYIMILPVTLNRGAAVHEQCITVELFAIAPRGSDRRAEEVTIGGNRGLEGPDDDPSDNFYQLCLGMAPSEDLLVLTEGEIDLFTWYDCAEATANPCDDDVSVELVARGGG